MDTQARQVFQSECVIRCLPSMFSYDGYMTGSKEKIEREGGERGVGWGWGGGQGREREVEEGG